MHTPVTVSDQFSTAASQTAPCILSQNHLRSPVIAIRSSAPVHQNEAGKSSLNLLQYFTSILFIQFLDYLPLYAYQLYGNL